MGNFLLGRSLLQSIATIMVAVGVLFASITASAEPMQPEALINKLFADVNERLKKDAPLIEKDRNHIVTVAEEMVEPFVSFDKMAKQILGKHWKKITKDQRARYIAAFKNRISVAMVSRYDPSIEYGLTVTGSRLNDKGNIAQVKSEVVEKNSGQKYMIDYKLFTTPKSDRWQVYDVIVEGVSVLQSYKTASAEEITRNGIEHLIAQLEAAPAEDSQASEYKVME